MNTKSRIVLVSCCAPCSCGAIAQLKEQGADFIVLFFNPNIYPQAEYQKRLAEQVRYCKQVSVKYHIGDYDHDVWLAEVRGLENEPERGARCAKCFRHRFRYAQNFAIQNGYDAIASVLGVSRHKNQAQVDQAAMDVLTKIKYLPIKFIQGIPASAGITDFYRQNYCGCEFSIRK